MKENRNASSIRTRKADKPTDKRLAIRWCVDIPEHCGVCGKQQDSWGGSDWGVFLDGVDDQLGMVCRKCVRKWREHGDLYAGMMELQDAIINLQVDERMVSERFEALQRPFQKTEN